MEASPPPPMLIDSPFHDYYDSIKAYGIDKTVVYRRHTTQVDIKRARNQGQLTENRHTRPYYEERVLGFCGRLYPLIIVTQSQNQILFTDEAREQVLGAKKFRYRYSYQRTTVFDNDYSFLLPEFQRHKVPIFVYREIHEPRKYVLELNPSLKEYGFVAIKDPPTAFQEIYQYISGVLGTQAPETVVIDDKHKAIAHGHDGKYSFRKPPGGGRWR